MLTLKQLVTPVTEDEALATCLEILKQLGFNATSWQTGSAQLTIVRFVARVMSLFSTKLSEIAAGGFTTLAQSVYLTALAQYIYNLERIAPQPTIGVIRLTSSAGAPVHTWAAGDLIVADDENGVAGAHSYTCTEGGTLGPNSFIDIEFSADIPGTGSNIAPSVTLFMWTPLVGVVATNPVLTGSNTWITTPGENEESDARLAMRCLGRWEKLTYGNTDGAYRGWALDALPALQRVSMKSAPGDGTVTLIGATSLGGLSPTQETEIEDYVNGVNDGIGRRPINDIFSAESADILTTPALVITSYVLPGDAAATPARITAALLEYFGQLRIGGKQLVTSQGYVLFDEIVKRSKTSGVQSNEFSISANIPLAYNQIYIPAITVNTINVAPSVL